MITMITNFRINNDKNTHKNQYALYDALLSGAVGDAYGLPFEGLSLKRVAKFFKSDDTYHLIPLINIGMVSDDTEHAVMTLQAYIASSGDINHFKKALKWRLVVWLWGLPAGIGLATGRSILYDRHLG